MFEDPHFRIDLAGARRYLESPDEVGLGTLLVHSVVAVPPSYGIDRMDLAALPGFA